MKEAVLHPITEAADIGAIRAALSALPTADSEVEAIDRITAIEELKAACAAAQAREVAAFSELRIANESAAGVPARRRGAGIGAEVGLAMRQSPHRGQRFASLAGALCRDMPETLDALEDGRISEHKAAAVYRETAWLPAKTRYLIDWKIRDRLESCGERKLAGEVRREAQKSDQAAAVAHLDRAEKERRVTVRPAPGNMAYLTALLPLSQAVSVYANLHRDAGTLVGTGEAGERTQSQMMADLLVTRATGQTEASDVPVEIQLIMTDAALVSADDAPAWIPGYGPVPAEAARQLTSKTAGAVFLRRLFTEPTSGQLVSMETKRRTFSAGLRRMVICRDDVCRTPWCDAAIKHIDHATPHADGGATSWANASGLCMACNYAKENPGWRHTADPSQLTVRTPTGHEYTADTPPITAPAKAPAAKDPTASSAQARGEKRGRDGRHRDGPRSKIPAGSDTDTGAEATGTGACTDSTLNAGAGTGTDTDASLIEVMFARLIVDQAS